MVYDRTLDKELAKMELELDNTKIVVSVQQYDLGAKKLQLMRKNKDEMGEWKWSKLGRLTKEEVQGTSALMEKMAEKM